MKKIWSEPSYTILTETDLSACIEIFASSFEGDCHGIEMR